MNGSRKCGVYVYSRMLFSLKREGNYVICIKMGEPGGYYAKYNKPHRGRHTAGYHLYVQSSKKKKRLTVRSKIEKGLSGTGDQEIGRSSWKGINFQF